MAIGQGATGETGSPVKARQAKEFVLGKASGNGAAVHLLLESIRAKSLSSSKPFDLKREVSTGSSLSETHGSEEENTADESACTARAGREGWGEGQSTLPNKLPNRSRGIARIIVTIRNGR